MSEQSRFTDEELVAFLDGEFEHTRADQIKAELKHNTELSSRLKQFTLNKSTMSDAFAAVKQTAPSYEQIMGHEARILPLDYRAYMKMAAVGLIALGIGFFSSDLIKENKLDGWHEYVAAYQALYATDTLVHVDNTDDVIAAELRRVSAKLNTEILISDLQIDDELEYKRGQILEYQGRPLIQLAFLSSNGAPVALCIMNTQSSATSEISTNLMENMQSAHWSNGKFDYFLIGPISEQKIELYATKFSQHL